MVARKTTRRRRKGVKKGRTHKKKCMSAACVRARKNAMRTRAWRRGYANSKPILRFYHRYADPGHDNVHYY